MWEGERARGILKVRTYLCMYLCTLQGLYRNLYIDIQKKEAVWEKHPPPPPPPPHQRIEVPSMIMSNDVVKFVQYFGRKGVKKKIS